MDEEPKATHEEIQFILENAARYLQKKPQLADIKSVFAGLRPLISTSNKPSKELSRKHVIHISDRGLVSVLGGKWTTYRKMAEDAMDQALKRYALTSEKSKTEHMSLHGYQINVDKTDPLYVYGSDRAELEKCGSTDSISSSFYLSEAQIRFAVKKEMAQTLEDVLCRRTRCILLNTAESIAIAKKTAEIMASELNKNQRWIEEETQAFIELAKNYEL